MEYFDSLTMLQELCKSKKKFGMYISYVDFENINYDFDELLKAAPYLDKEQAFHQFVVDDHGWLLFDTRDEMEDAFARTVGDDGPTELNSYNGPACIHAITCNDKGELENENT